MSRDEVVISQPNGRMLLAFLERSRPLAGPVVGVAALVIVAVLLSGSGFAATLLEDALVYAIAAMAVDFLGGYAGLVSLGMAGFLGIGAYSVAIAEVHGFSPWAAVGVALAVVLGTSAVLGVIAVRVKGVSFVIITLAMGQIIWGLGFQWVSLSEGDNGITLNELPSAGGFDLNNPVTLKMTCLVVFVVAAAVLTMITRSPFGLSLRGIRSNEPRMGALGYRTGLHRYLAWVIAGFFAGVSGILFVFVNGLISPDAMDFSANGFLVVMAVLGGLGSIWGPAIGALIIVLFQQELSIYVTRWQTLMGCTLIAVVLFGPGGLWGLVRAGLSKRDALIARLREQVSARPPGAADPAGAPAASAEAAAGVDSAGTAAGVDSAGGPTAGAERGGS
jgi:branched-chain amino acid transport system permease protein